MFAAQGKESRTSESSTAGNHETSLDKASGQIQKLALLGKESQVSLAQVKTSGPPKPAWHPPSETPIYKKVPWQTTPNCRTNIWSISMASVHKHAASSRNRIFAMPMRSFLYLQHICSTPLGFRIGLCNDGRHAMRSWQNLPTNPSSNLKGWELRANLENCMSLRTRLEGVTIKRCSMQIRAISFISYSPKCEGLLCFHNLTPIPHTRCEWLWDSSVHPCYTMSWYWPTQASHFRMDTPLHLCKHWTSSFGPWLAEDLRKSNASLMIFKTTKRPIS